ncbi:MAG: aspartate--tRNA(Asn) ligase [Candidatus Pacebacteria bacterium]|nr:aspartate--tRNA(Asn) ligase [Candidatus Paceibacterota bacterium]
MQRILITETAKYVGKRVKVAGWVNSRRDHGGIVFLDLRDRSGLLQVVATPDLVKDVKEEYVLEIEGEAQQRPIKMVNPELATGQVELKADKIEILAKAETPSIDLKDLKVSLPVLLDYRPLTLRNKKIRAIFQIEEEAISQFRESLKNLGFTEFQAPVIVPTVTEGGAELFPVKYYEYDAYLAQSPQLYKQILVGVFERVFTITKVFRAEPSVTTRHLSEYLSLDAEMGFIDSWQDLMDTCERVIKEIFSDIENKCQKELKMFGVSIPKINQKIPRLKLREAQEIIFQRTKRDNRKENDLEPEDEKEICEYAKEKYGSELIFITHFPTKKRPFYTFPDPENPDYTLSFDLLCRGLEIVTGGQRIHDYETLLKNIKKWQLKPADFKFYLQAFKYGMPPEGGFAIGAERLVKQILNLENVREASLFPRDTIRIDQRLIAFKTKRKKSKK